MCAGATSCNTTVGCEIRSDGRFYCGPFGMSKPYWLDAGAPLLEGGSPLSDRAFKDCAKDVGCSFNATTLYLQKLGNRDCDGDGRVTCIDYTLINYLGGYSTCEKDDVAAALSTDFMSRYNTCAENLEAAGGSLEPAVAPECVAAPVSVAAPEQFTQECVACMCAGATSCNTTVGCEIRSDGRFYCGPFGMSKPYWLDAGAPLLEGGSPLSDRAFKDCAKDVGCSFNATTLYLQKLGNRDCDGDGRVTCIDYTLINYLGGYSTCEKDDVAAALSTDFMSRYNTCAENLKAAGGNLEPRPQPQPVFKPVFKSSHLPAAVIPTTTPAPEDRLCLTCICQGATDCDSDRGCHVRGDGQLSCGPFAMTLPYWQDAGSPVPIQGMEPSIQAFKDCAKNVDCSHNATVQYLEKFGYRDCDGDGRVTCLDNALINHLGGSSTCPAEEVAEALQGEVFHRFSSCSDNLGLS